MFPKRVPLGNKWLVVASAECTWGWPWRGADGRRSRQLARQSLHLAEIGYFSQSDYYLESSKNISAAGFHSIE